METTLAQARTEELERAEYERLYDAGDYARARETARLCERRGWTPLRWRHNYARTFWATGQYEAARHIYLKGAHLLDGLGSDEGKAIYLNGFALVLKALGEKDPALIEYAAASYHFEQAGRLGYAANVQNNVACLLLEMGLLRDAWDAISRSIALHLKAGGGNIAEAWDTLEQIKRAIAEGAK